SLSFNNNHMKYLLLILSVMGWPAPSFVNDTDGLPLNGIQVIGSHNSYKQAIAPALFALIKESDSGLARHIDYDHISLTEQLNLGLLDLEIDVYADAKGGKYAHPKGLDWAKESNDVAAYDPQGLMKAPGFKVFHIQDIDFRSNCATFVQCLRELKSWSDAHPDHEPIFITMNAKDEPIKKEGFTVPEKFEADVFDRLDKEILDNLGRENLLVPDDVRGGHASLEEAVLHGGWPHLKDAKGRFMFILDETGEKRATYIQGHPSLKGRVLFANAEPGTAEAAFLIMNDPVKQQARIQELVKKGYIVRTRADADTEEARRNDKSHFEAACRSGAQVITTDYYAKSKHFVSDYSVSFDDGKYFRVNPLYKTGGR
ncbi:MAG TPA: phosphatidylinositol-specific phospholipase C1-like protein, partial [Chitinophagaceae bacterium]|nr:phosphatidylinositol-specific phospholipase C1-like protein [Chitinophagaceae bacterium]